MFIGALLGQFGDVSPASALVAPAPLPVTLGSVSSSVGLGAGESAALAGAGGTAIGPVAAGAGIAGAGVLSLFATAQVIGFVTRAVGGSTEGLCAGGKLIGALYGQDCSNYAVPKATAYVPNTDASGGTADVALCRSDGTDCVTLHMSEGLQYRGKVFGEKQYGYRVTYDGGRGYGGNDFVSYTYAGGGTGTPVSDQVGGYWTDSQPGLFFSDPRGDYIARATCFALGTSYPAGCSEGTGEPTRLDYTGKPGQLSADPQRYFQTTVTFTDGSVGMSPQSALFRESDATIPQYPEVPSGGKTAQTVVVREWLADGSASKVVLSQDTGAAYRQSVSDYPDCAGVVCKLQVFVRGKACTVGGSQVCEDWFYEDAAGKAITCRFGSYVVDLSECNALSQYYKPDAQAAGVAIADPATGNPVSTPTGPSASDPATGGGITTDPSSKDCLGSSVTSNPVTWVVGPVTCAIKAAFVPSDALIVAKQADLKARWSGTQVAGTAGAVGAVFAVNAPASSCSGFTISLNPIFDKLQSGGGDHTIHVANACEEPIKTIAAICNLAIFVTVGVAGALAVSRYVGQLVNYGGAGSTQGDS